MDGRFVIEGKLGCPVCDASYPIASGVARFADESQPELADPGSASPAAPPDPVRIAALVDLTRPGKTVVIEGAAAAIAHHLVELTGARVITVNAPGPEDEAEGVAAATVGKRLPLASASVDGLVIGPTPSFDMTEASRVLRRGGRLLAPASLRAAEGPFRELARDGENVVLEAVGEFVKLTR
jgi:hypothetical protein